MKAIIQKAGGGARVASACADGGMVVSRQAVAKWGIKNSLPNSEWTGETSYASVLCRLVGDGVHPIELCPGAGQYMAGEASQ